MEKEQNKILLNDICNKYQVKKHQLLVDYLKCKNNYKISYDDYLKMHFYSFNEAKRKEILTPKENIKLINQLNPFDLRYQIVSKNEFNHRFDKYIKRDWLLLDDTNNEEFRLFIKSRNQIFVPPVDNHKMAVVDINHANDWQLHQELINTNHYIVEEVIKHHSIFNEITDKSLITIKFITLLENKNVHLLGSYLNIESNEEKYYIPVDIKNGKTYNQAIHNYQETDSINNYQVKEFKIPLWKEAIKMVNDLPLVIPELRYISWEIAITDNDVILIKASDEPNINVLQHPIYLKNNDGLLKQINQILGGQNEKNGI